jgi:hypothetical protein
MGKILIPTTDYIESSLNCLLSYSPTDDLIICPTVFAELGVHFLSFEDLKSFLRNTGIKMTPLSQETLFEAGRAWKNYLLKKKDDFFCPACGKGQKIVCKSCAAIISAKKHLLNDFIIGAHAKNQADQLITRDRGFYRSYFKELNILNPAIMP